VVDAGHDLQQFAREALEHLRDLYVLRVAPDSTTLVDVTAETRERLAAQADRFGPGELGRLVRIVGETYMDLRTATDQRLVLEVGLAKAALPEASLDADALLTRIERLERRLSIGTTDAPAAVPADRPAPVPVAEEAPSGTGSRGAAAAAAPAPGTVATRAAAPARAATDAAVGRAEPAARAAPATTPAAKPAPAARAGKAAPAAAAEEPGWGPAEATANVPVDLDLVRRSWPLVIERVQAASRVTASFLGNGQPVALEGRQVVVELPRDKRFEAEALTKDGRNRQVDAVLEAVLGGGLQIRVVVGDRPAAAEPAEGPAPSTDPVEPPPAAEFEVDPANDEGRPLDADADARAVADWAAKELGGQVIEERPNQGAARRGAGSRAKGRPRRPGS
jgi:DNA polymerase-3 subunit gamma/tau